MQVFQFAFGITGPILILLSIGYALRLSGVLDEGFLGPANTLVFKVAMPAMLFFAMARTPLQQSIDVPLTLIGLIGTLLIIVMVKGVGRFLPAEQRGVFVQGSYRGNLAILGLALSVATYGDGALPVAALYIAAVTTLYNVVAVWLLSSNGAVLSQITRNPILLGLGSGALASAVGLPVPEVLISTGRYLSEMTLPIALLCIGASLDMRSARDHWPSITLAVLFKLVVSPILLVGMGIALGLSGERLGVLFFLAASPTASASYIMARQMTTQGPLAAEIVAITTALGVLSCTVGLATLRTWGLI